MEINLTASSIVDIGFDIKKIVGKFTKNPSIWAISTDENYLKDSINQKIKKNFFPENSFNRVLHMPNQNFDWQNCLLEAKSLSLFSVSKFFDVRLLSGKPGISGSKAIIEWCENSSSFSNLILNLPKLDYLQKKSDWFRALNNYGLIINIISPDNNEMRKCLNKIFSKKNIPVTYEALDLLVEKCQGNLSMAYQEIEKISLSIGGEKSKCNIDENFVRNKIFNVAKYSPFDLPNLIFKLKDKNKSIRVLNGLKNEDFPLTVIIWVLAKECRNQILPKREVLLKKLFFIDKIVKGILPGNAWIELEKFVLNNGSHNE